MKVLYFAWLRERIGHGAEDIDPAGLATVSDLIDHLSAKGPEYQNAFTDRAAIRAAVDQVHVAHDAPLNDAREVALFPPMTGG